MIPVYNEQGTLRELIRRVRAVPIAKEILLVDDGSKDGSRAILREMEGEADLRIFYHDQNQGKGAGCRPGSNRPPATS